MRLLVSVRDPEEVDEALAGGADIVDAKEPDLGPLGAVPLPRLRAIAARVPAGVPLSIALGDPRTAEAGVRAVREIDAIPVPGPAFLKVGCLGVGGPGPAASLLAAVVAAARSLPAAPRVVAVAYADADGAAPSPDSVLDSAARAGAAGVLLDTVRKDGGSLLERVGYEGIAGWVSRARARRLLVALAGRLRPEHVPVIARAGADVIGVRGAACAGGRSSRLVGEKVRALRVAVDRVTLPL